MLPAPVTTAGSSKNGNDSSFRNISDSDSDKDSSFAADFGMSCSLEASNKATAVFGSGLQVILCLNRQLIKIGVNAFVQSICVQCSYKLLQPWSVLLAPCCM